MRGTQIAWIALIDGLKADRLPAPEPTGIAEYVEA
jgi:hypothetical protein